MRYYIGLALIGLGVFLLATSALFRFYAAPRLILAPTDIYQVTRLQAQNATYFDASSLTLRTGATITVTNTLRGDVKASHGGTAVWDSFTLAQDLDNSKTIDIQPQRLAFDRRTAELTNCCGASVLGDTKVRQSGIGQFWPINVAKKTYQFFEVQTERAWPIRYEGVESVHGIKAYRFVLHVPSTKVSDKPTDLPGTLLGLGAKSGSVAADRYSQVDATYWIDSRTGTPVDIRQQILVSLQAQQGPGRLVVADMDLRLTAASQREVLAKANDAADQIRALRLLIPLGSLLGGLVLLALGIPLSRRTGHSPRHRGESAAQVTTATDRGEAPAE